MDEPKYFKASCIHCGNHIEFPAEGLGRMVECPHCGQQTQLRAEKAPKPAEAETPEPPKGGSRKTGLLVIIGCVAIAAGVAAFVFSKKTGASHEPAQTEQRPASHPDSPAVDTAPAPENPPVQDTPPAVKRPKALSDLKVGGIQFETAKGSSLVYAVGKLNNDSDYQRFGVRIELDLVNQQGNKVGTAQDYKDVIEPHKSWQFRALVTDPKAVSATVTKIKEDE